MEANVKIIDGIYPKLRIDLLLVKGVLNAALVKWLSRELDVPANMMVRPRGLVNAPACARQRACVFACICMRRFDRCCAASFAVCVSCLHVPLVLWSRVPFSPALLLLLLLLPLLLLLLLCCCCCCCCCAVHCMPGRVLPAHRGAGRRARDHDLARDAQGREAGAAGVRARRRAAAAARAVPSSGRRRAGGSGAAVDGGG
jgi:hypothetical protein